MKKLIRLTENDLHRIINNSVKRVLREAFNHDIENGIEGTQELLNDEEYENYTNDDLQDYFDDINAETSSAFNNDDEPDGYTYW